MEDEAVQGPRAGRRAISKVLVDMPEQATSGIEVQGLDNVGDQVNEVGVPKARLGFEPSDLGARGGGSGSVQTSSPKTFTGISRRKQEQLQKGFDVEMLKRKKYEELTRDEVMDIPELEEEGKEDLTQVVAEAPKVRHNRVQDIQELEDVQTYPLPEVEDRDVDLSLLTACLQSLVEVTEKDEVWDPEQLWNDVASEITFEKERQQQDMAES